MTYSTNHTVSQNCYQERLLHITHTDFSKFSLNPKFLAADAQVYSFWQAVGRCVSLFFSCRIIKAIAFFNIVFNPNPAVFSQELKRIIHYSQLSGDATDDQAQDRLFSQVARVANSYFGRTVLSRSDWSGQATNHIDLHFKQRKTNFMAWVNRTVQRGFLNPGTVPHIQRKLNQCFDHPRTDYTQNINAFEHWIKIAQGDGHFTAGNVKYILQRIRSDFSTVGVSFSSSSTPNWKAKKRLMQVTQQKGYIHFYQGGLTGFLGNFYELPNRISYKGHKYRCVEAAFQAQKYPGYEHTFTTAGGKEAFRLRQKYDELGLRKRGWDREKDRVMLDLLRIKFAHPQLKDLLLSTQNAYLVEHNEVKNRDNYWSDNYDGTGHNKLGKMLMRIRGEFGGAGIVHKPESYKKDIRHPANHFPLL